MNDLPSSPSRLLRATAFTARWLLGLLLAAWLVLVGAWGILHGWIVPRIAEFRPQLEAQATRAIGIPVRIGHIEAHTVGLVPSFSLHDVQFFDRQGQVALRLPTIVAALSPRSVWHLGFEQLYIDGPELDIRRAADGRIYVAGLDVGGSTGQDDALQKWFFSQREFVIRNGTMRWTDEQRQAPPLAMTGVNVLVRNTVRRHALHVDAAVPPEWGSRFSVNARFRQPLLSRNTGDWRDWDGLVYTRFDRVDVSRLRQYADLGVDVTQGNGALRFWTDLRRGQVTGITADMALAQVSANVGADKMPLGLQDVTGRLSGKRLPNGFELATQNLQFTMPDGRAWPGGNVAVVWKAQDGKTPPQGELHADRLDLAAMAQLSHLLPLDEATHAAFQAYAPRGVLEKIDGRWRGGVDQPAQYSFKGRVVSLQVAPDVAVPAERAASVPHPGRPGLRGATVAFDLDQAGGTARLTIDQGSLTFPGVFEEPEVPMDRLSGDLAWQLSGDRIAVQVNRLKFANADTEGEAQVGWRTGEPSKGLAHARFPGVLDLQGSLSRADGTRVYRYLPLVLPSTARDYVRAAVQQGRASSVKFRVRGDLRDLPYRDPRRGEFRIAAKVQDVQFDYIPAKASQKWPALTQLQGELVFDRSGMQVRGASGRVDGLPGLQILKADAQIPDLAHSVVQVHGDARGPASEVLALLAASPVSDWTSHALDHASASGNADYRLQLNLPVREIEKSKVQGTVTFAGNDFQLNRESPAFSRGRGVLSFNEAGFALQGVQATLWGGDIRLEGGTPRYGATALPGAVRGNDPSLLFRAQGTVSAEGLRQARELGPATRLARHASGASSYSATLTVRRGVPEILVQSSLQGLALNLPPPLNKPAEAAMPVRYEQALYTGPVVTAGPAVRQLDQLSLDLGSLGSAVYVRDVSGAVPRVLRGGVGVGLLPGEAVPLPMEGVAANIHLPEADVDAWSAVLSGITDALPEEETSASQSYLPNTLAVRAKALTLQGHRLQNLVVGGSRQGPTWRANLEADELSGYLEYRQSSGNNAGRLYARLARLVIAPSAARQVEALLSDQPSAIPALDIVVDDLDLRGKKLGRVDIEAVNGAVRLPGRDMAAVESARDWRLNRFNISLPEGRFSATGNWTAVGPTANEARRTVMNFKLDIADAGGLLARFGMKDVVRRGQGKLEGQVAWTGSPLALDHPTLDGQFNVDVENGQFLKADPGLAKLLGVLSLQSLPRRLALDFRDVFSEGFAFDFLRGDVRIDHGIAFTNNLQMKGVNAAVLMEGRADIARETQDVKVVVVPEINAGTASLVASVINPVVGLTTFLTQVLLRRPLIEAATQEFHIDGAWADPHIVKVVRAPRAAENKATEGKPEGQP